MRSLRRSAELHEQARRVLAGGVSSDARRVPAGAVPLYVDHASGSRLWDVDGNEYIDYVLGQGPLLFGHSNPSIIDAVARQLSRGQVYSAQHVEEVEVAELVCQLVPCAELVRFNSVGSEAIHAAWRLARGVTGREKVLKFEGHYHGWFDPALYSVHPPLEDAGRAERPRAVAGTKGQARSGSAELVIAPWNDVASFDQLLDEHEGEIAAVVMEPWLCNTGCIGPDAQFLERVRQRTSRDGIVLIFDEVITGFRLAPGGGQELVSVTPDLAVFGKAMAGGLPLSCLAGRADIMDAITRGEVGHAGTFNSNPVVIAAAGAALRMIRELGDALYAPMRARGRELSVGITERARAANVDMLVDGVGTVFQTYQTTLPAVRNYRDFTRCDAARTQAFHAALLDAGINIVSRGLWFLSTEHSDADVEATLTAVDEALEKVS